MEHRSTSTRGTESQQEAPPAASTGDHVGALIAATPPTPPAMAQLLRRHPDKAREIIAHLHGTLGNGFVQQLLAQEPVAAAAHGTSGRGGPLPHRDAIQAAFGRHDVSQITAHTDGRAAEGTAAMGAAAFAQGDQVAFGGAPDLHTAAHEAAHVVQQRGGIQLKGGAGEEGDAHEQHADAVADAVVRGDSAEALLDERAGSGGAAAGIQRKVKIGGSTPITVENVGSLREKLSMKAEGEQLLSSESGLSEKARQLITGSVRPTKTKFALESDVQIASKFPKFSTPSAAWSNWGTVKNLPPSEVFDQLPFQRLVESSSLFGFASTEELLKELLGWNGKGEIPMELMKRRTGIIASELTKDGETYRKADPSEKNRLRETAVRTGNCGETAKMLLGRINETSGGKALRQVYKETHDVKTANGLEHELASPEPTPMLMQVTFGTGVHVLTLEKRGDHVVLHQGYQSAFDAMWWGGMDPKPLAKDANEEQVEAHRNEHKTLCDGANHDPMLSRKRDEFGKGRPFPIGPLARMLAKFLAGGTWGSPNTKVWEQLPVFAKDDQMRSQMNSSSSKDLPVTILLEKYALTEEVEKTSGQALGGSGEWLTNRVIGEVGAHVRG